MKTICVDGQDYEIVKDEARILTEYLFTLQSKLGIPESIRTEELNDVAWQFVMAIFAAWRTAYPREYRDWTEGLENELKYERPIREATKGGGFMPIAYPVRVYDLMKVFLPNVSLADRDFIKKLLERIPELKTTNYKL